MTKEELINKLNQLSIDSKSDEEIAHCSADEVLLEFINDPEVTKAFKSIKKWYA